MTTPNATFELYIPHNTPYQVIRCTSDFPVWAGTPEDERWAIQASIEKWEFAESVLEQPEQLDGMELNDGGTATCALCSRDDAQTGTPHTWCTTCPIYKRTGHAGCIGTPYEDFCLARTHEAALEAARAQIAFLKSLR